MALSGEAHQAAFDLFRDLLRIDTTNPPGNEAPAAARVADFLADAGIEPRVLESAPGRANVVARIRGTGAAAPLLLTGHLDVVPADRESWSVPPFAAEVRDGWLYGRGAVDMKNMVAMSATVLAEMARSGARPLRDVVFAAVADEETGCEQGAAWLVDHHPDLVRAEYALGEVGAFSMHVLGRTFYPIQVAEKGLAWLRMTASGEGGHGSIPREDSAVVRLSEAVARIGRRRLPQHRTEVVARYFREVARRLPVPARWVLPRLLDERLSGLVLDRLLSDRGLARVFATSLSNTVSPTVLRAGGSTNVIPEGATAHLDGRTLPGQSSEDLVRELREVVGPDVALEVFREMPPVETRPEGDVWETICECVTRADPAGIPVPYLLPGFTDAKAFHRLGTRWFGCAPLRLPEDGPRFADLYHRSDERIPVEGFHWGLDVLGDIVGRLCGVEVAA